jgi:hypothetical protein
MSWKRVAVVMDSGVNATVTYLFVVTLRSAG